MGEDMKEIPDVDLQKYISGEKSDINSYYMVYYMLKGAPSSGKSQYSEIPKKYFNALCEGKTSDEADKIAWEGVNAEDFEKDFKQFWKKWKSTLKKADSYNILKDCKKQLTFQ